MSDVPGFVGRLPRAVEFGSVEEFTSAVINSLEQQSAAAPALRSVGRRAYDDVPAASFLAEYARTGTPVVLTGAAQSMGYDLELWQPRGLSAVLPEFPLSCRPSGVDYDAMGEPADRTLAEYLGKKDDHSYGANMMLHPALIPSIVLPDLGFPQHCFRLLDTRLWIGKGGTGAHLHQDIQDNCILMLAGSKRVSLQPPHRAVSLQPWAVTPFLRSSRSVDAPGEHDVEVLLRAGDLLWLPAGWWHSTENILQAGEEAGVSINFFMSACFAAVGVIVPEIAHSDWLDFGTQPRIHKR